MGAESLKSWKRLGELAKTTTTTNLNQAIASPNRFRKMSWRVDKLLIDFSKQRVTDETVASLIELAKEASLEPAIENLFQGVQVNPTEGRAALHMSLRAPPDTWPKNLATVIEDETSRFYEIVTQIRSGIWRGTSGNPIKNIVHIGIGGSHLGPELACKALGGDQRFNIRFLTNIDGSAAINTFAGLDPTETLIIVVSKSFSTLETLKNAHYARDWFLERTRDLDGISQHFIAVTANASSAKKFGIPAENCLPMWDWIGGRYSLWSAVGLPIALVLGGKDFRSMLGGAHKMDCHFQNAPLAENVPVLLALYGIWNSNFLGSTTHAVLVYQQRLATLTNYLQQLEMESNGKSTLMDGSPSKVQTSPVVWGGEETNGQHAFHQLLHQGTRSFAADFIAVAMPEHDLKEHHQWLLASCLSQGQAMLQGTDPSDLADDPIKAHRKVIGNHSTTTILLDTLDPESLGSLIALYEHKVFCQGVIWQINSFDQWGGELGKQLAKKVFDALNGEIVQGLDSSTIGLIKELRKH